MKSLTNALYEGNGGNDGGSYVPNSNPIQKPNASQQGLESKVKQMLTAGDIAEILRFKDVRAVRNIEGLPKQYVEHGAIRYYKEDFYSYIERLTGRPVEEPIEPLMTAKEVSTILHVTEYSICRGVYGLPILRLSRRSFRYDPRDLREFLEKARGQKLPKGPLEPLLTGSEVARQIYMSRGVVWYWSNKGILPVARLGPHGSLRYDLRDVKAFAKKRETNTDLKLS